LRLPSVGGLVMRTVPAPLWQKAYEEVLKATTIPEMQRV
jgi:hypothetical protein